MTTPPRKIDLRSTQALTQNTEPWLSCDDCFTLTDVCVEDLLEHHRPPSTAMAVHLAACTACHDEVVALLTLLAEEQNIDPEPALNLLATEPPATPR